jgi:hypothetical protein
MKMVTILRYSMLCAGLFLTTNLCGMDSGAAPMEGTADEAPAVDLATLQSQSEDIGRILAEDPSTERHTERLQHLL